MKYLIIFLLIFHSTLFCVENKRIKTNIYGELGAWTFLPSVNLSIGTKNNLLFGKIGIGFFPLTIMGNTATMISPSFGIGMEYYNIRNEITIANFIKSTSGESWNGDPINDSENGVLSSYTISYIFYKKKVFLKPSIGIAYLSHWEVLLPSVGFAVGAHF